MSDSWSKSETKQKVELRHRRLEEQQILKSKCPPHGEHKFKETTKTIQHQRNTPNPIKLTQLDKA